ncbi:amphi-Trp domain-containing protein [Pseudonocardia bannensis]|uniref:Amphi-Trp domain-containing protein n=1 Tax=Pseudonocardia bannensis TaxID=630973 RepID=A0A848DNA1_9PSEU|nr:amphi-Trp domain-containing protein [Pseudonocardia bannensis]NMH93844.1 amphi-Trp domain-containing protein [Pseudonocardia bannensis]
MADVKIERKEPLTRWQAARWLSELAAALERGGKIELTMGGSRVSLHVPDHVHTEFELEVDGDEVEVELELSWSTAHVAQPAPAQRQEVATGPP